MATVFLEERRREEQGNIPVTLLLIEILGTMQEAMQEEDADVYETLQAAVLEAGLIEEGEILEPTQVIDLAVRLQPKKVDPVTDERPRSRKRSFGSDFLAGFEKWSLEEKCIYAAGFDYEYARKLYCEYDKSVVEKIIGVRISLDAAFNQTRFEAVVFGMGGSMGGSNPANDLGDVTDFAPDQKNPEDFLDAAAAFERMQHSFRG